jgi:hypothetical protein
MAGLNEETHTDEILAQAGITRRKSDLEKLEDGEMSLRDAQEQGYKADATDADGDGLVQDGTKWERKAGLKAGAVDGDGDGMIQDGTEHERPAPVAVAAEPETIEQVVVVAAAASEPEVVEAAKPAAPAKRNKSKKVGADFSNVPTELEDGTVVSMERLVFENQFAHNSASVIATQKRLIECGFITAGDDNLGFLSVGTKEALQDFATDVAIETEDFLRQDIIEALFIGTVVKVTL